jgi:ATP/maltotriose-dependent transcriptional regulator MalT
LAQQGGETREGERHADAALALAERVADPAILALALAAVAQNAFAHTGAVRHDLLDRALELEDALDGPLYPGGRWSTWHSGLPLRLSPARVTLALLLGRSNRHDESRALWRTLTGEAAERADPDVVRCLFHRAQMEMTSGAWDTAAQLCDEAMQLAREVGLEVFTPLCLAILAEIDAYRGESDKARSDIPELLEIADTGRFRWGAYRLRIALAVLELSCEDGEASWRHVAPLFDDVEELDVYLAQLAGSAAVEALIATGDLQRAEQLLAQIDGRAADGDTALRPLALRCRGVLQAATGDQEGAIASLKGAALPPKPPQGENPFELARTLLVLGTTQRRARHKRDARESLQGAAEIFDRLGARLWSEKAHAELARIGGRAPSTDGLTPSEQRIAELVAGGKTNKEVAAILVVADRTVESALTQIYRKLDVRSRTELAHRLAAQS